MDDPELLRAYLENASESAFATLVARYTGLVYATALRQLGGRADLARDVTQDVFTDLARKAHMLRGRPILTGWLYTSTHFAVAETLRTEKRRRQREQQAHTLMQVSSDDRPDAWHCLRPVLDEAMRELGDDDRESILLRYFEGRRFSEIGAKLALGENAARMRVERALDKMQALLSKRGLTSTSAALALMLAERAVGAVPAGLAGDISRTAFARAARVARPAFPRFASIKSTLAILGIGAICAGFLAVLASTCRGLQRDLAELRRNNLATANALDGRRKELAQRTADLAVRRQLVAAVRLLPASLDAAASPADRRMLLRIRSALMLRYARLFRALRLPAPEQEKLEALLLRKSLAEVTALRALSSRTFNEATPLDSRVVNAVKAAVTEEVEREIEPLLGEERFRRYQEFARTLPIRQQVEAIAVAAPDPTGALSDEEMDGLTEFVARAPDYTRPLPDALLAEATTNLDIKQQAALGRLQGIRLARATILETNRTAAANGRVRPLPPSGLELDTL